MKNILSKIFILLTFSLLFSCESELEYGSNFDFKVNNIDNTSIVVNTPKLITLELTEFFNPENNKTFTFSYEAESLDIINENITLLKGNDYSFTFDEQSTLPLTIVATKKGNYTLTLKLTDAYGMKKEQKVIVKAEENLSFTLLTNTNTVTEKEITVPFDFALTLTNIGTTQDTYQVKAFSSLEGTILINNKLAEQNTLYPVETGNISLSFTAEKLDVQTVTLVVVNSANVEKEITFDLKVLPKVFTVNPVSTFEVKQTLTKEFSFVTVNTIPTWKYQVKFSSLKNAKISTETDTPVLLNTFIDLPLNSNNFTFKYSSDIPGDDNLTITVQDKNGQIVSSNVDVKVNSAPTIEYVTANLYAQSTRLGCRYDIVNPQAYGTGIVITEYEFSILNSKTGVKDVYTTKSNTNIYSNNPNSTVYFGSGTNPRSPNVNESNSINWYRNQPYTVRVKDSEGVWSETIKGVMSY